MADPVDLEELEAAMRRPSFLVLNCALRSCIQELRTLRAENERLRKQVEADAVVRQAAVDALAEAGCSGAGLQEHVGDAIRQLRKVDYDVVREIAETERLREADRKPDALREIVRDWLAHCDQMDAMVRATGGRVRTPEESAYAGLVARAREAYALDTAKEASRG